jgi:hypothetical protein
LTFQFLKVGTIRNFKSSLCYNRCERPLFVQFDEQLVGFKRALLYLLTLKYSQYNKRTINLILKPKYILQRRAKVCVTKVQTIWNNVKFVNNFMEVVSLCFELLLVLRFRVLHHAHLLSTGVQFTAVVHSDLMVGP